MACYGRYDAYDELIDHQEADHPNVKCGYTQLHEEVARNWKITPNPIGALNVCSTQLPPVTGNDPSHYPLPPVTGNDPSHYPLPPVTGNDLFTTHYPPSQVMIRPTTHYPPSQVMIRPTTHYPRHR